MDGDAPARSQRQSGGHVSRRRRRSQLQFNGGSGHEVRGAQPLPTGSGDLAPSTVTVTDAAGDKKKKVFRCTFPGCGREFQLKGNLKRHVNIHNGDKKFACKFCGKRFLRKADMEVHYRVHTGEKPYRCKYQDCGKCFARRSDLLSHERTHT